MLNTLNSAWWALILRGVLAVLFGILAIAWPGLTLATLVQLVGLFAIVDGLFALVTAIMGRDEYARWWLLLAEGIVSIVAGVVVIIYTGITALALLHVIAIRAVVVGVAELAVAWQLRREVENEWLLALSGAFSVIFGVLVVLYPGTGALAMVTAIGIFAIFFGLLLLVLGWEARTGQLKRRPRAA